MTKMHLFMFGFLLCGESVFVEEEKIQEMSEITFLLSGVSSEPALATRYSNRKRHKHTSRVSVLFLLFSSLSVVEPSLLVT